MNFEKTSLWYLTNSGFNEITFPVSLYIKVLIRWSVSCFHKISVNKFKKFGATSLKLFTSALKPYKRNANSILKQKRRRNESSILAENYFGKFGFIFQTNFCKAVRPKFNPDILIFGFLSSCKHETTIWNNMTRKFLKLAATNVRLGMTTNNSVPSR